MPPIELLFTVIKTALEFAGRLFFCIISKAQIGINTQSPDASAALEITSPSSGNKGLLMPRLTTLQRQGISSPADGLLVYDTDIKLFYYFESALNKWLAVNAWQTDVTSTPTPTNVIYTNATVVTNVGIGTSSPSERLEVVGNIKSSGDVNGNTVTTQTVTSSVVNATALSVPGFPVNSLLPAGSIIMWYGNVTTTPTGWVLCDGNNNTPDLRGRFIVGFDNRTTDPGNGIWDSQYSAVNGSVLPVGTGGEKTHTLTKAELPQHQHTVNSNLTDNGQISVGATHTTDYIGQSGSDPFFTTGTKSSFTFSDVGGNHSHGVSGNTGDGTTSGLIGSSHENRPPYYVLVFIMKTP
jgi:microcystin-dependent protein